MKRPSGFTLVEVTIALLVMGVVVAVGLSAWSRTQERESRVNALQSAASEMAVLSRALAAWTDTPAAKAMGDGQQLEVTFAMLESASLLPPNFASRYGGRYSVLGGPYAMYAHQSTTGGTPSGIVMMRGVSDAAAVRVGATADATSRLSLVKEVAAIVSSTHGIDAGWVAAGDTDIVGNFVGFEVPLTTWTTAGATPAVVSIVRLPSLDRDIQLYTDPAAKYGQCYVMPASGMGSGVCAAGQVAVASWRVCQGFVSTDPAVIDTEMGKITYSRDPTTYSDGRSACGGACAASGATPGMCGTDPATVACGVFYPDRLATHGSGARYEPGAMVVDHVETGVTLLNGVPIHREVCRTSTWSGAASAIASVMYSTAFSAGYENRLCCTVN